MREKIKISITAIFMLSSTLFYSQNNDKKETAQKKDSLETPTNNLDEIVVVGSRTPNKSKLETTVPIDVVSLAKIRNVTPQTSINDILTYLIPAFNSNRQSASDGTEHIDPASLRGLGPDQTLVLINGKRRHTTSLVNYQNTVGNGSVGTDLSTIPASAIKRIEVLRDGAAAQYGSDAIAGVINLVLRENTGLEVNGTYGQTSRGDGQTSNLNINYGHKLGDKGGFINLTAEFNNREKTNRSQNHNLIIFDQSAYNNYFAYDFTDDPAASRKIDDDLLASKGLNRDDFNFQVGDAKIQNIQGFVNTVVPLDENIEFYASGGFNQKNGTGFGFRRLPSETENVVPELFPNGFQPELKSNILDVSLISGFRFKYTDWKLDLSNTFGVNNFQYNVDNTNNFSLGAASPTSFDAGSHSFTQNTMNADASRAYKSVFKGLNLALGAEFRFENYKILAGETASYVNGGAQSFPGFSFLNVVNKSRNSTGIYADAELNFTDKFLVDAAVRFENYTDFGNTTNGKLSARYKITEKFFVRGSASTGFRAPSLQQQYFNNIATDVVDGKLLNSGIFRNDSDIAKQLGIPELKEETSTNYSFGIVYSPSKKLHFTVDAYQIKIDNRIILTGNLGNDPYGDPVPELRAIFATYGAQTGRFFTNAINTKTKGIDFVADYDLNLGDGNLNVSLLYNYNKNEVDNKLNYIPTAFVGQEDVYFGPQERSLIETNTPLHKGTLALNYGINKFNFLLRNTYFGEVTRNGFPFGIEQKHNGKVVTDLSLAYKATSKIQFIIGANNLFDVFPDKQVYENSYFGVFKYAPVQMGTTGAYYFGRISYSL
jgi:iron complex outermembrane receptor protein